MIIEGKGDLLPVSAFPVDGTWPTGTAQWEKRAIALEIPVWDEAICIQCNKCAFVCPHAAIRAKVYDPAALASAPATFKSVDFKGNEWKGQKYTIQVAPEDCTGCNLCVMVCPVKDKSNPKHKAIDMAAMPPLREAERLNYAYFLDLPEPQREEVKLDLKGSQFLTPLFEYSGACAGCGETPYIKLMTQLFGDRVLVANATGCSSIYGGNLPTTPYTVDRYGRGPAWSNSLFEDNAEFGLGMRLALDQHMDAGRGAAERPRLPARRQSAPGDPRGGPVERGGHRGPAPARDGAQRGARRDPRGRGAAAVAPRRLPGQEERLDRGRRRLGLRHRLRRPRPRAVDAPRRQRAGARHRGLLEHGRPAVEGHPDGRFRQVRLGGQGVPEEGHRHDGDGLRPRLRGARRVRRQGRADAEGVPGGRELSRDPR